MLSATHRRPHPISFNPCCELGAQTQKISDNFTRLRIEKKQAVVMELAYSSCSFPVRITHSNRVTNYRLKTISRPCLGNSSLFRARFKSNLPSSLLSVPPLRLQRFLSAGVSGDTITVTNNCSDELVSFPNISNAAFVPDESSGNDEKKDQRDCSEALDYRKMIKVCDKLIEVFLVDKPTPTDWRRLLTFSKDWNNIRPHFYQRCQDRADSEDDPGMKHKFLRLGRKLKEIDEDVQRHNELLELVKGAPSDSGINEIVVSRRKDFTKEFFIHLHTVAASYYDNPSEQTALAKLGNMCLAAVQAYDNATESIESLNAAELKLQDIINSPSLDVACRKIDSLAEKNQLDSALVLMITKAWSAVKESNMTKDEVKDIMYHLYMTARGNLQRLLPKEVRIVKYLLTIEDHEQQMCALADAFTPGEESEGKDIDNLYTSPEKLHTLMKAVVDAYNFSQEGTLLREARDLLNPIVIEKLEQLIKLVEKNFM